MMTGLVNLITALPGTHKFDHWIKS